MTDQEASIVALLRQLNDEQQDVVVRVVETAMRAMGFGQPIGPEGANAGRRTSRPKTRT